MCSSPLAGEERLGSDGVAGTKTKDEHGQHGTAQLEPERVEKENFKGVE